MENQMIMKDVTEISPLYQEALELHRQIIANGTIAASAMVELCRNLKLMRDKKAYAHLGYDSFDDYVEQMANMKKRQAYNYISTYERLGPEFLQSNAQLGITKLELLAQLPAPARDDLVDSDGLEEMSTRELRDTVAELTKAREQLSFLEDTVADEKKQKAEVTVKLQQKIKDLETAKADLERKLKADASQKEAEIKAKLKKQIEADAEKKIKAAEEAAKKAREEGLVTGRESLKLSLDATEKEKAAALARAKELEKQLQVSGHSETVIIDHLLKQLQETVSKLEQPIGQIAARDPETAGKFKAAIRKYMLMAADKF